MERDKLIRHLILNFIKALFETLKPFQTIEEKVNYLETLIDYLKGVYSQEDAVPEFGIEGDDFDADGFIRKNILLKHKDKAKPFVDAKLRFYFGKDKGLQALFTKLKLTDPILNEQEYDEYIYYMYNVLNNLIEKTCVQSYESAKIETENKLEALPESGNELGKFKSKSQEFSRTRQILLFYYILKLMGLTKLDNSTRKYAQFAHVLFAWPCDNIDNSEVYKKLKQAPYLKKDDEAMIKDLEFIKQQFELIANPEGIAFVQKEIDGLKRQ